MKRIRLISFVVAVIVLGGLAFAVFRAREPRYQGRTLSEWIGFAESVYEDARNKNEGDPRHPETEPDWQIASHALKQMAPGAIPVLLRWVHAEESLPKKKLAIWLRQHPSSHFEMKSADEYHEMARIGFFLLGDEAKPAWPILVIWTYSTKTEIRYTALRCLAVSKPDKETILPVLLRLIHDPNEAIRLFNDVLFRDLYPEDARAAGLYEVLPYVFRLRENQPATNQARGK